MAKETKHNKWKVNRAGLFNYWYYEDQAFDFAGGKLLLRGNNGAGKSVTMQSFLPVLLDGSTRPERLDPFGSRARRMEDYLLGEKEISKQDERTGYLYMEFKREETDQYVTVGIGLQAKRGKPLKFWGFVLTDNRRVGMDFLLYKMETHDGNRVKIPLSKIQLSNQVADGGHVVDTRREYASLVNQYVFGYETIEEYEDLIKLLIQLRSPKLSKDFRPTVIYEILEEALPPLSDEDLRHLSDTIEQMDQTKQQLEQLEREHEAITSINQAYTAYNEKILYEQASGYIHATEIRENNEESYRSAVSQEEYLKQEIDRLDQSIQENQIEMETAEKKRIRLQQHKVWNLEQERQDKLASLASQKERLSKAEDRWHAARMKEYTLRESSDQLDLTLKNRTQSMEDILEELEADAVESSFKESNELHQEDFNENKESAFAFDAWTSQVRNHLVHLETVRENLREMEQLTTQFQAKDKELGQSNQEMDELRDNERDWEQWFKEEKNTQLNKIHEWIRETDYLRVSEERIQQVSRALDRLYDETRYDQVREPIQEAVSDFKSKKQEELASLRVKRNGILENTTGLERELEEWKKKKDPDPNTHPLTKEARQSLADRGIEAIPLYNLVEFREEVREETQKRIEAALLDSGLIDALVTENEFDIEHDRVLKPNPQLMAYTLSEFLKPDIEENSRISVELVDNILQSILIDESDDQVMTITEEGQYTIGLMKGHALPVESVRYVGKNARKRYREEQIALLEEQIVQEKEQLKQLDLETNGIEKSIFSANEDFGKFPDDNDLSEAHSNLEKIRFNMEQLSEHIHRLSEEVKKIGENVRSLGLSLDQQTKRDTLSLNVGEYTEALRFMRDYERNVAELRREQEHYLNEQQRKEELVSRLADLEEELIELKGDANVYQAEVTRLEKDIEQIVLQMEQEGVQDIRKQIEDVQQLLKNVSSQIENQKEERTTHKTNQIHVKSDIEEKETERAFSAKMVEAWEESFTEEMKRNFASVVLEESTKQQKAREILKQLKNRADQEISQLVNSLSRVRNDVQDNLIEYSPLQRTVYLEIPLWMNEEDASDYQLYLNEWKQVRSRELIELNVQGKRVSPYVVEADLNQEKERQQIILDDQDKQLYEEILFQSVGNKLRARIGRAERWVEEMKELMESRNDSSGVEFSIRWKPRTAETEEELDTKDLVGLLRQDPRLLKEEDIDRVTTHFRTKIERAKALIDESTEMQTLLQVLKQVLDYRRWFSFELSVKRAGEERKKPLTNTQFDKFSGGEKARSMYIPLFIATYSRYLEASPDAPYLISLDEAFAGVDDSNIADLFDVVEELGFNYIMNSQAIWGDYETVSELAISELFRPQNADHVAVIRYIWDGKKRELVTT